MTKINNKTNFIDPKHKTNVTPYRGFLDGRINKNQYQLILRLSNMELKKI